MGRERFLRLLEKENRLLLRGELWVADEVLRALGLAHRQDSLIDFAAGVGADICFFSCSSTIQAQEVESGEMEGLVCKGHARGLACGVAVDGPFERLVRQLGFVEVMTLFQDEAALKEALQENTLSAEAEMAAAEKAGADLLILCDDIAFNMGLYFSPGHFKNLILPLYRRLRKAVGQGALLGFHSDGNIGSIIMDIYKEGYSLFSVEPEAVNLVELMESLPGDAVIISGIKADWLVGPDFGEKEIAEIKEYISSLVNGGRLILSSACGIFNIPAMERLRRIYELTGYEQAVGKLK